MSVYHNYLIFSIDSSILHHHARIAQLVEQLPLKQTVGGSNPSARKSLPSMQQRNTFFIVSLFGGTGAYLLFFLLFRDTRLGISMISNSMIIIGAAWTGWLIWCDRIALHAYIPTLRQWWRIGQVGLLLSVGVAAFLVFGRPLVHEYIVHTAWAHTTTYTAYSVIMMFYIIFSVPLQELIFRGYFLGTLQRITRRPWLSIGGSSALYGLAHSHYGWQFVVLTFLFGLLLGGVMHQKKDLSWSIYLHWIAGTLLVAAGFIFASAGMS